MRDLAVVRRWKGTPFVGACAAVTGMFAASLCAGDAPQVDFESRPGELVVTVAGRPVASYVYVDDRVLRPYFAHVKAPHGVQLTRNYPPIQGQDRTDHETMHPGIWMAFGDLGGEDFWRNKARVVHEGFVEKPSGDPGEGTFVVRNRYRAQNESTVCREECRIAWLVRPSAYLLVWDSTFYSDRSFYFGDQEEMGLAFRVATPISVAEGGTMLDAQGRRNENEIWGHAAPWCDYSGIIDGSRIGITVMCHPENFRPCWLHARDYGFIAANPFGRNAFGEGPPSRVVIKNGEKFRLRYGMLMHFAPADEPIDLQAAYRDYVQQTRTAE